MHIVITEHENWIESMLQKQRDDDLIKSQEVDTYYSKKVIKGGERTIINKYANKIRASER